MSRRVVEGEVLGHQLLAGQLPVEQQRLAFKAAALDRLDALSPSQGGDAAGGRGVGPGLELEGLARRLDLRGASLPDQAGQRRGLHLEAAGLGHPPKQRVGRAVARSPDVSVRVAQAEVIEMVLERSRGRAVHPGRVSNFSPPGRRSRPCSVRGPACRG